MTGQGEVYNITVLNTGASFACRKDETVLEAMKRASCGPIHYGCFGGGCGVCKMKVVSGEYQVLKRMSRAHVSEAEQKDGAVLICCIKPCCDLKIAGV